MKVYGDASFLVALYVEIDTHSEAATDEWERLGSSPLIYTPLHRLEVRNAIRQFEHGGDLKRHQVKQILRRMDQDLIWGVLVHTAIDWTNALRRAERVGGEQTNKTGVSGMDLLHIGVALDLRVEIFLTFDERQLRTADLSGLHAKRP
jgi:predicted nucleic acid-binding protein